MAKLNWEETLKDWQASPGAVLVSESERIRLVSQFCKYVAENMWDKIEFFEADPLAAKGILEKDKLSKNAVFEQAAIQITEHQKVWAVVQVKFPDRLTYEFPLVVEVDKKLRYMKFQINEGVKGLASPSKVKKVWLRYHVSAQAEIEVKYVEN